MCLFHSRSIHSMTTYLTSLTKRYTAVSESGWLQIPINLDRYKLEEFLRNSTKPILFDANDQGVTSQYQIVSAWPSKTITQLDTEKGLPSKQQTIPKELNSVPLSPVRVFLI